MGDALRAFLLAVDEWLASMRRGNRRRAAFHLAKVRARYIALQKSEEWQGESTGNEWDCEETSEVLYHALRLVTDLDTFKEKPPDVV